MSIVSTAQIRHSSFATSAAAVLGLFLAAAFSYAHAVPAVDQPSATTRGAAEDDSIRPFHVHVPDQTLVDLRRRIAATRWPDKETVADQSQGVQEARIQALVQHWGTDYDWRKAEARLNALPMFVTTIDGVDIQFIHVKSRHPHALPLIVTTAGQARLWNW